MIKDLSHLCLSGSFIRNGAQEENEATRNNHRTQFAKNLGLIGGLLMVLLEG
jgi:hypothetical protein